MPLPEGTDLQTVPRCLVVHVIAAPSEEQMDSEIDTEGAGVVEEPPQTADDEG